MTKVVSTQGLVRRPNFEEVLNAAIKDEHSKDGLLSVPMQRFATKMINSPLFQRAQSTVETELEKQEQNKMEHDDLQNDLHRFSVATGVPQDTMQYVVQNLQQPTPAPPMQVGIRRQGGFCQDAGGDGPEDAADGRAAIAPEHRRWREPADGGPDHHDAPAATDPPSAASSSYGATARSHTQRYHEKNGPLCT